MPLVVSCPHCAAKMRAPDDSAGKHFRCPTCRKPFALRARPGDPAPISECLACGSKWLAGAVACMDCGYLRDGEVAPEEGAPLLCTNPACGVANPPGERYCQRCSS